ncbi:hypothetical protein JCM8547_006328 [Rhodosporidiobolus lusitaniae]
MFRSNQSYPQHWLHQRIYPRREDDAFDAATPPSPTSSAPAALSPARTLPDGRTLRFVDASATTISPAPSASPTSPAPPAVPLPAAPPLYYPGANRRPSLAGEPALPPGHAPSTNTARSIQAQVQWAYHPSAPPGEDGKSWKRFLRYKSLGHALRGDLEELWDGWPREFGGREIPPPQRGGSSSSTAGDEEEGGQRSSTRGRSISLSRRSTRTTGADSGVALTPRPTMSLEGVQHPLTPLYKQRIAELNTVIGEHLALTRMWLALLEIGNYAWVIALIVALATGGGKQTGFLKGVEIALVLVILLNGTGVNAVRMRRYRLSLALRQRQRDWSPLATSMTSTNAQLMRNYLDGDVVAHNGPGEVESVARKDQASLRWRLRGTEGSYWLSYRPSVHVELVTPASALNTLSYLPVVEPVEVESVPLGPSPSSAEGAEARAGAGAGAEGVGMGAPPGYEEAVR